MTGLSRATREWLELASYAVGTPAPPTHEAAKELQELVLDHDDLDADFAHLEDVLDRRDLSVPDHSTLREHLTELLDNLAACRDHLEPHGFNLVTGEAEGDEDTPTGASRLQRFLADHDDLVRFRARVVRVMEDCGALDRELDNDRMVNLLRMLMPGGGIG